MNQVQQGFCLKDGIEDPKLYLGTNVQKWSFTSSDGNDKKCLALGSESYVKEAVRVSENLMKTHNLSYPLHCKSNKSTPFSNHLYRPELDYSSYCNYDLITVFQNLIGILRWMCKLGHLDILYETSVLSQYLAQPRIGHLEQAFHIFHYMKYHN